CSTWPPSSWWRGMPGAGRGRSSRARAASPGWSRTRSRSMITPIGRFPTGTPRCGWLRSCSCRRPSHACGCRTRGRGRWRAGTRASDVVARRGGDEFVVLLPEASAAPARLATEKLRGALADVVPAHGWRMTASIGVATFLVPPESVDELLGAVDGLMYRAKQGGKNGVAHETRNE